MATDLKDDATHEEIQEVVEQLVEDRKEPEPEEKGDAQKIAEERDEPTTQTETTTAETDSGSDDTAPEGEEAGDSEGQTDWLDADLKAEVAAYGIDEKELADFTSREELERALRFFDKSALEAGRKEMAKGDESKDSKKEPEPKEEEPKEGQYEIGLDKAVYDEELVGELTRMRDHYETRVAALETRDAERDAQVEEQRFDGLVDSLGHADLFGKSGKETKKELERREDLFIAVKAQQIGLQHLGRPTDLDGQLINRVARMVFVEELGKKDLKARTRKISKQANSRGGDSATKGASPVESLRDEMRRHYKELDDTGSV